MWLLPPHFPPDAFDLPPGTRALPWYANERHISTLMQLLVIGEARIEEWLPLPWTALDDMDGDAAVRTGSALVLRAPESLSTGEIEARAQTLPWPYVFWHSPRPALEGQGAWLEREVKPALSSEVHRSLLDPEHPLARFHVERLPLALIASMVADPVDLLELAQAAIIHRLEHSRSGLLERDFEISVKIAAGQHLGEYVTRIPENHRNSALIVIRHGGRASLSRAVFRQTARSLQDVGLGLCVGEDLALGPLARRASEDLVWQGLSSRLGSHSIDVASLEDMQLAPTEGSHWHPAAELRRVLAQGDSNLVEYLDRVLPGSPSGTAMPSERVAARIEALGYGPKAALVLVTACFDGWREIDGEERPFGSRSVRETVRRLVAVWLPWRYGDDSRVVRRWHVDPAPHACVDLEVSTDIDIITAVLVAGEDELPLDLETTRVGPAVRLADRRRMPLPASLVLEQDALRAADEIAAGIAAQFPGLAPDTPQGRRAFARARLEFLLRTGSPSYVVTPRGLPNEVLTLLKTTLPALRIVSPTGSANTDERLLLQYLVAIFGDADADG